MLSFVFSIPSISLAAVPQDSVPAMQIPVRPLAANQIYDPNAVLPHFKLHCSGFPGRFPLEEDHIRVWSINEELENNLVRSREPERFGEEESS